MNKCEEQHFLEDEDDNIKRCIMLPCTYFYKYKSPTLKS